MQAKPSNMELVIPPLIGLGIGIAAFVSIDESDPQWLVLMRVVMGIFAIGIAIRIAMFSARVKWPPPAAPPRSRSAVARSASQTTSDNSETWGTGAIGSDMGVDRNYGTDAGGGLFSGGGPDSGGGSDSGDGSDSGGSWS